MKTLVQKIAESAAKLEIKLPADPAAEFEAHGMDSLDLAELSMTVEDDFSVEFTDAEVQGWRKVGDIEESLKKKGKFDES